MTEESNSTQPGICGPCFVAALVKSTAGKWDLGTTVSDHTATFEPAVLAHCIKAQLENEGLDHTKLNFECTNGEQVSIRITDPEMARWGATYAQAKTNRLPHFANSGGNLEVLLTTEQFACGIAGGLQAVDADVSRIQHETKTIGHFVGTWKEIRPSKRVREYMDHSLKKNEDRMAKAA